MYTRYLRPDELMHFGVLGMKWGVRRYQNPDGSLTAAGRKRYGLGERLTRANDKGAKWARGKASKAKTPIGKAYWNSEAKKFDMWSNVGKGMTKAGNAARSEKGKKIVKGVLIGAAAVGVGVAIAKNRNIVKSGALAIRNSDSLNTAFTSINGAGSRAIPGAKQAAISMKHLPSTKVRTSKSLPSQALNVVKKDRRPLEAAIAGAGAAAIGAGAYAGKKQYDKRKGSSSSSRSSKSKKR